jgi:hypothetical protein
VGDSANGGIDLATQALHERSHVCLEMRKRVEEMVISMIDIPDMASWVAVHFCARYKSAAAICTRAIAPVW